MSKAMCSVVLLLAFFLVSSQARSILISQKPQPLTSFKINTNTTHPLIVTKINTLTAATPSNTTTTQRVGSCSYTVVFTTSCSSARYTRDRISLSFGDAYGNQVYAPRLDDPSSRAFEACSMDTYDISGPCTYDICYMYTGADMTVGS